MQSLTERYEYVKISRNKKNFEYFKKIANILAESCFNYFLQYGDDDYTCCVYDGNEAYGFEFILSLSRFYLQNENLFDGHIDIIKRCLKPGICTHPCWRNVKKFWLDITK